MAFTFNGELAINIEALARYLNFFFPQFFQFSQFSQFSKCFLVPTGFFVHSPFYSISSCVFNILFVIAVLMLCFLRLLSVLLVILFWIQPTNKKLTTKKELNENTWDVTSLGKTVLNCQEFSR